MARTCPIAKVLERNHEVEILGFDLGDGFYEPWRGEFEVTSVAKPRTPIGLYLRGRQLSESISGDVVYAFRPCAGSFGVGLYHKRRHGTPLLLDIEDLIRFNELGRLHRLYQVVRYSGYPNSEFYADVLRHLTDRADAVTVTSRHLQEKYDATRLTYGPDSDVYDPETVGDTDDIRSELGDDPYAIFAGTIRPHKGLDELARAVDLAEHDVKILILGYDPEDQIPELRELSGGNVEYLGTVPHDVVPRYLDFATMVLLPQKQTRYTQAQVPEKTFEAMSMAKPIVASDVADFAELLDGCGRVVEPDNPAVLSEAIDWIVDHPDAAREMGERAREKYVSEYGWDAMERSLEEILQSVTAPREAGQ